MLEPDSRTSSVHRSSSDTGALPRRNLSRPGRGDPDQLVVEERLGPHAVRDLGLAGDAKRELTLGHSLGDPGAGADRDVDLDPGMAIGEALQERGKHVGAGGRRGGQRQRSRLGPAQRLELLLHPLQGVEHPGGVGNHHLAGRGTRLARPFRSTSFSPIAASSVFSCLVAEGWLI